MKWIICDYCKGFGWTAEHDNHPHENGDCHGLCPIQVECERCKATGKIEVDQSPATDEGQEELWKEAQEVFLLDYSKHNILDLLKSKYHITRN